MTTRTITGPIYEPDITAIQIAAVRFTALRNNYSASHPVVAGSQTTVTTSVSGSFTVALGLGEYRTELQYNGESTWNRLGNIVVESGASTTLGALIEETRDMTLDLSVTADWITYAEATALLAGGAVPGDIDITDLGLGTAISGDVIMVEVGASAIVGESRLMESLVFGGI